MSSCIEFTGNKNGGYGRLMINGRQYYVHRLEWEKRFGKIPKGMSVLHSCDNRACINTDHLWLGTYLDNNRDKMYKGRCNAPKGEQSGHAKLTDKEVLAIRKAKGTLKEIASEYNITLQNVWYIKARKTWKHI